MNGPTFCTSRDRPALGAGGGGGSRRTATPGASAFLAFFPVLVLVALGAGCVAVNTTSQALPGAEPPRHQTALVWAPVSEPSIQIEIEEALEDRGQEAGLTLIPYHDLFLVSREYGPEEFRSALTEASVEVVILILDATMEPPTAVSQTQFLPTQGGGMFAVGQTQVRQDRFTVRAYAFEMPGAEETWMASMQVRRRHALVSDSQLVSAYVSDLLQVMQADGLLDR